MNPQHTQFAKEWNEIVNVKIPIFEFEVIDKRTNEKTYITFDIFVHDHKMIAQHESTTKEEVESNKIAFCSVDIDYDFSADYHLQAIFEECLNKITSSDWFELLED